MTGSKMVFLTVDLHMAYKEHSCLDLWLQTCPINILPKIAINILLKVAISKNNSETSDPEDIGNAMALFLFCTVNYGGVSL